MYVQVLLAIAKDVSLTPFGSAAGVGGVTLCFAYSLVVPFVAQHMDWGRWAQWQEHTSATYYSRTTYDSLGTYGSPLMTHLLLTTGFL